MTKSIWLAAVFLMGCGSAPGSGVFEPMSAGGSYAGAAAAGAPGVEAGSPSVAGAPQASTAGMAGAPATPQIDPLNCETAVEPATTECDAEHTLVIRCGAGSGVGEANPDALECVPGVGAVPGHVWCCSSGPTCNVIAAADGKQTWRFWNAADRPGVPDSCTSLGGGAYECDSTACLVVPYTGTCPAC
jgi:hypothetical protein